MINVVVVVLLTAGAVAAAVWTRARYGGPVPARHADRQTPAEQRGVQFRVTGAPRPGASLTLARQQVDPLPHRVVWTDPGLDVPGDGASAPDVLGVGRLDASGEATPLADALPPLRDPLTDSGYLRLVEFPGWDRLDRDDRVAGGTCA